MDIVIILYIIHIGTYLYFDEKKNDDLLSGDGWYSLCLVFSWYLKTIDATFLCTRLLNVVFVQEVKTMYVHTINWIH